MKWVQVVDYSVDRSMEAINSLREDCNSSDIGGDDGCIELLELIQTRTILRFVLRDLFGIVLGRATHHSIRARAQTKCKREGKWYAISSSRVDASRLLDGVGKPLDGIPLGIKGEIASAFDLAAFIRSRGLMPPRPRL